MVFELLNHINLTKRRLDVFFVSILLLALVWSGIAQDKSQPELLGTWHYRNEDFSEFVYHKLEFVKYEYLEKGRNGIVIARICSSDPFPRAFVTSWGFAFSLPEYAGYLKIPADKIYFATYSRCGRRSEQYWFVPDNAVLDYDEKISSEQVEIRRWLNGYRDKPTSEDADAESFRNTRQFVIALKSNARAEGFIVLNSGVRQSKLNTAMRHIRRTGIDKERFRIVRKRAYQSYYPEFMVITINQPTDQPK